MVFFILGLIDIIGGTILLFSQTNFLFLSVGVGMIVKGAYSIIGDTIYLLSGE